MTVYLVMEQVDAYPEDGGGLRGVVKVFKDKAKAHDCAKALNDIYADGDYGCSFFFVDERQLN